ncbi:MAG: hypothetical protein MR332_12520 [Fusicatenibacter sp.]|nr:hypothetical protein [Fusicatenibacter sp.]
MTGKSAVVTVREELQHVENYVKLMNLRYDFTITLSVRVSALLCEQEIPKMLLYPIVENAIVHGIEEMDEDAVISIKGMEREIALI